MEKYQLKNGNYIEVIQDNNPINPREEFDCNLTKMVCFHSKYSLGDKHEYKSGDYGSWAEIKKAIEKDNDIAIIKGLWLFDHSGITIATEPFSCKWDSGQVGYVFITKQAAREMLSVKNITAKIREELINHLDGEVEIYNQYLTGDVYGFKEYDKDGEEIDSCYGFFGSNPKENGMCVHLSSEIV